eukprot:8876141-Ditylum_brightwellii.AAC.1
MNHTVELLYFMGLSCTPVTSWYALDELIKQYKTKPLTRNVTTILIEICKGHQGGLDRTCGHCYSPSAGKSIPENMIMWSQKNLYNILKLADTTTDTELIIKKISKHPSK